MRIVLALIGVTFLVGGGARAASVTSGLYGDVTRGPITPVCVAEQPCSAPAAGAVLAFSRSGQVIARTRVRADGSYRIALSPGMYSVRAVSARPLDPSSAWVRQGRFRHVDFAIDTGIR
jgi:hypothetical protein